MQNNYTVPRVSVIIPSFNTARTLDRALASVLAQTEPSWEALIINDGSTDDTLERALSWAERDSRFRVITKPNGGYGAACNRGLREATGTYVAILEPDDYLEPGFFKDLADYAQSLSQPSDIIRCAYWRLTKGADITDDATERASCAYRYQVKPSHQPCSIDEMGVLLAHHPSIWAALYRRQFLIDKHIRFEEYPGAGWADNPFLIDTLLQTERISYLGGCYYNYFEDTVEQALAFAAKNPLLPLERWHTMQDRVEAYQHNTPAVRLGQAKRALTYCNTTVEALGLTDPVIFHAVRGVMSRLNPSDVLDSKLIAPAGKRLYAQVMGLPEPHINKIELAQWLLSQTIHRIRCAGLKQTLKSVGSYLHREHKTSARLGELEEHQSPS